MQLPDEAVAYQYQSLLVPTAEEWTPAAELRAQHFLPPTLLRELAPRLQQVRSQVAAERELRQAPAEAAPLESGFIDLPQKYLDEFRRKGDTSVLGRIQAQATRLRKQVDRVVVLAGGALTLGPRALFKALRSTHHNELPPDTRLGVPRVYFEGANVDNDALQELLDLLQTTCVDPELREECWGVIVMSPSGLPLETAALLRTFRREAGEFYGLHSDRLLQLIVPISGSKGKARELGREDGPADDALLSIPGDVGERYAAFTPAGLLPAAVMDLDVRALLLGAATMTRRFLEEPFERNPVLQFAGINYLMATQRQKTARVLSVWSTKLEALGLWYEHLLAESLGKQGQGPTPLTLVQTRDLYARGQELQQGTRDKLITNLVVRTPRQPPIMIGMVDRNPDDLNQFNRKSLPDVLDAALHNSNQACFEAARPTADLVLPTLSEHTLGQLMQMLMLATVVEARLLGLNPYGQAAAEHCQEQLKTQLKSFQSA